MVDVSERGQVTLQSGLLRGKGKAWAIGFQMTLAALLVGCLERPEVAGQSLVVTEVEYAERWPFSDYDEGVIRCRNQDFRLTTRPLVTIELGGTNYGLNGAAFGIGGYLDARQLLNRDPETGAYQPPLPDFIDRGLDLCDPLDGPALNASVERREPAAVSGRSPECGPISGKTTKDRDHLMTFCSQAHMKDIAVGAYAYDSILWIKVPRGIADALRFDRLTTEQLVKTWMKVWKRVSGNEIVTIYVKWQDVEIAKGQATAFSGDKVTIR